MSKREHIMGNVKKAQLSLTRSKDLWTAGGHNVGYKWRPINSIDGSPLKETRASAPIRDKRIFQFGIISIDVILFFIYRHII